MSEVLDIHPASESERLAAYRNTHDVWSGGLNLEDHVQRRLQSPQHSRADWFVGCLDGRVVTSLACYPLQFGIRGRIVSGISFGSVHTLAEFRGRGFAPQLIRWVEALQSERGKLVSLLYSDIDPAYYARLGYRLCPSWSGWRDVSPTVTQVRNGATLEPFAPHENLSAVAALYERHHLSFPVAIARDADYWAYLLRKDQRDEFFWLKRPADGQTESAGYVRLGVSSDALAIRDFALIERAEAVYADLLHAAIALANERELKRVGGWLPSVDIDHELFTVKPRQREITMLKPLSPEIDLDDDLLQTAAHFVEIDHV
jgi:predicted N-acetyltransferase YhbS